MNDVPRTILVLEDQSATLLWLVEVARTVFPERNIVSVTTVADARRWLKAAPVSSSPLALIDIGLPDGNGIDFLRELLARIPAARAVILTLYEDDTNLFTAMGAGAHGYILKDREQEMLIERLRRIDAGEVSMSPVIADRVLEMFRHHARFMSAHPSGAPAGRLTAREEDVLRMIGRGLTVPETGTTLGLSALTVSGYVKAIYRKLDISSRAEAAVEATRRGLV